MSPSKTILITGASIGIGRATAELFQSRGWNVVATMRKPDAGKDLVALPNVLVTKLDVTDQSSIDAAISAAIARFGSIDVLVNNAGYGLYGILEATSIDQIRQQFETNVIGLLATTKAVIPHFRRQHSGVIVNIGSIAGRISLPTGAPYNGTKFAVEGISEALLYEMRAIGVRVKLVEPGVIKTNFGAAMSFVNDDSIPEYQPRRQWPPHRPCAVYRQRRRAIARRRSHLPRRHRSDDQLRFLVGKDAEHLINLRNSLDDNEFLPALAAHFGQ